MSETSTRITGVRTVSVPVTDQDRALEFYKDALGFEIRIDASFGTGQRWIELAAPGATTTIALAPPGPGERTGVDTGIRFETTDAEADHADLQARGVDVDPQILRLPNVPAMFMLRDPDGNILRVIEEAPRTEVGRLGGRALKRFAVLVKSDASTEAGAMPQEEDLAEMTSFNDELAEAGVLLAAEGFHASSDGARIRFAGGDASIVRGPFPEPQKLVAGYWVIQARSLDEAIDLMKRAPMGDGAEIEIRQAFDPEEFGEAFTPELRQREERQIAKMKANTRRRAA